MMLERGDVEREGALSEAAPRTVFDFHSHGVDTLDAVRSGRFRLMMAGHSVVLGVPVVSLDGVKR
ncbi:hypothetical protein KYC5002_38020 [Archangium violaceum]|uniref:hypothetical protein n=1 Tax=Archangium violaceum TaxID=83451 RepID=UPI002B32111D|nr:hypothetical protein KYC5002_38020 [Archangium gephyra]